MSAGKLRTDSQPRIFVADNNPGFLANHGDHATNVLSRKSVLRPLSSMPSSTFSTLAKFGEFFLRNLASILVKLNVPLSIQLFQPIAYGGSALIKCFVR